MHFWGFESKYSFIASITKTADSREGTLLRIEARTVIHEAIAPSEGLSSEDRVAAIEGVRRGENRGRINWLGDGFEIDLIVGGEIDVIDSRLHADNALVAVRVRPKEVGGSFADVRPPFCILPIDLIDDAIP